MAHWQQLLQASLSQQTKETYRAYLRCYLQFCQDTGSQPVPATEMQISLYITSLSQTLAFASVMQYLTVMSHLHKAAGLANPLTGYWVQMTLQGCKATLGMQQTKKLLFTPALLCKVRVLLDLQHRQDKHLWAAILLGWWALLRKANLATATAFDPNIHLCRGDFTLTTFRIRVTLKQTKTICNRERSLIVVLPRLPDGNLLCPVLMLTQAFLDSSFQKTCDPALMGRAKTSPKALSKVEFDARLRVLICKVGLNPRQYSGHSLWRGGATFAMAAGVSADLIQLLGDWKSSAYQGYLDLSLQQRQQAAGKMAAAVQAGSTLLSD